MNKLIIIFTYVSCFGLSLYALSGINYAKFTYVSNPNKVRVLLVLLAMGLSYVVAEFILNITVYI